MREPVWRTDESGLVDTVYFSIQVAHNRRGHIATRFCCNLTLEDELPSRWQCILGFHVGFLAESLGETKLNNMDTFQHVVSLDFD